MPLEDLDLEFEDEDEASKKKKEAVNVDVDLEFQGPQGGTQNFDQRPRPAAPSVTEGSAPARPLAQVKNISEAKPASAPKAVSTPTRVEGANALKLNPQSSGEVAQLRQELSQAQIEIAVKDAIMDFKVELLSELSGDTKLLDFQVNQLLNRLAQKHPDSKQEFLMIKKLLADFTAKKRK